MSGHRAVSTAIPKHRFDSSRGHSLKGLVPEISDPAVGDSATLSSFPEAPSPALGIILSRRGPMATRELPTGTVTFLFSDIEGSTRLVRELGNGYVELLQHRCRLRET